jgi:hypothetical protein
MQRFYVDPEIGKALLEKAGGDLRHPVVDQFCQSYVNEYIKIENKQLIKRTIICFMIVFIALLIGFLSL